MSPVDVNELVKSIYAVVYQLLPSVFTVVFAGFFLQRFFVSRANEASFIDSLIKQMDDLRTDTLEYWNLDCTKTKENKMKARILEQKIKGAIKIIGSDVRYYSERYKKGRDLNDLVAEISDSSTGGEFESATKRPDTGRYTLVVNSTNRLKSAFFRNKF